MVNRNQSTPHNITSNWSLRRIHHINTHPPTTSTSQSAPLPQTTTPLNANEPQEIRRNSFKLPDYLQGTSFADWVQEKESSKGEDGKQELYVPTAWSNKDKNGLLDLSKFNMRVTYIGPGKSESDISAIRANHFIPPQCGIFYFEIEIISKGRDGQIGIGFCANTVMLSRLPGWEPNSWGYHGDDGNSFNCTGTGKPYGPTFGMGDVIGCGINFRDNTAFFTKNGINLGIAFRDIRGTLYPSVGLRTPGEQVEANFGQKRFKFDIEHYMSLEKTNLWKEINAFPIPDQSSIPGDHKETSTNSILNLMLTSYLVHHGYLNTAKKFASNALGMGAEEETNPSACSPSETRIQHKLELELSNDQANDIRQRKTIRDNVLMGRIDDAIRLTELYYPTVFETNEEILFKLKCQKFAEMMIQLHQSSTPMDNHFSNHDNDNDEKDACMDIDDEVPQNHRNHTSANSSHLNQYNKNEILMEIISYGHALHNEFGKEDKPFIKSTLVDVFALLAYANPYQSAMAYLLDPNQREPVANALNSAILVSQGRPPIPSLELLFRQASVCCNELVENGIGDGALVKIREDCLME